MNPKDAFDAAIKRANHLLTLYDIIRDTRKRDIRRDWAISFKSLMHWPGSENIVRIDGKDKDSILILRESLDIKRKLFAHDYVSELLRAAIVAAVSALDRYMHDLIVEKCWGILKRAEKDIPREMKKLKMPVLDAKRALDRLRKVDKARPGYVFKQSIQETLHSEFTFQSPDAVCDGAYMLGVKDFWRKVTLKMPGQPSKKDTISKLKGIVKRRNQIVHEADIERMLKKTRKVKLRDISRKEAQDAITWVRSFVDAIEKTVN